MQNLLVIGPSIVRADKRNELREIVRRYLFREAALEDTQIITPGDTLTGYYVRQWCDEFGHRLKAVFASDEEPSQEDIIAPKMGAIGGRIRELIERRNNAIASMGIHRAVYFISTNEHAPFAALLPHVEAKRVLI